ncbi:MAG: DUF554 domain-containing protein [Tepidanaerobacteraceae bacterium]|jgi:uncharacterized membrane protein YqgA involved in biofilm formation|nr:DUF554 domain-containing protein [Thermoanaerobacterales bacterium]
MLGTIVNTVTVVIGALLGCLLKERFSENIKNTVMHGLTLTVMLIGISMAISTSNFLIVTLSMVIGGIIGELLKIEDRLNAFGNQLEARFAKEDGNFTKAFVSASLVYCVGAMAILGAIQSGLSGDHSTLFVKSILDGVSAIVFSSTLGIGVAFAAIPVFLYQGAIALGAASVKAFITDTIITEMTATGGLLIFAIGINLLGLNVKIKVGNLLPAVLVAVILARLFAVLPI